MDAVHIRNKLSKHSSITIFNTADIVWWNFIVKCEICVSGRYTMGLINRVKVSSSLTVMIDHRNCYILSIVATLNIHWRQVRTPVFKLPYTMSVRVIAHDTVNVTNFESDTWSESVKISISIHCLPYLLQR